MHIVMSAFSEMGQAETAVADLQKAGFPNDKISVLLRHDLVQPGDADEALLEPLTQLGLPGEEAVFYTNTLTNDGVLVVVEARGAQAAEAWRVMQAARAARTQDAITGQSQNTAIYMPVVGLFPDSAEASEVMKLLLAEGIKQEEIYLIDAMNLKEAGWQNGRFPFLPAPTPLGTSPLPLPPAAARHPTAESHLTRLGIDEADAPFYLDAVRQGGTLLIVTTDDKEEAAKSRKIMKAMDVTQMAAPA